MTLRMSPAKKKKVFTLRNKWNLKDEMSICHEGAWDKEKSDPPTVIEPMAFQTQVGRSNH